MVKVLKEKKVSLYSMKVKNMSTQNYKTFILIKCHFCFQEQSQTLNTQFLLSDQVYVNALVPPTDKVCLWLGVSRTLNPINLFKKQAYLKFLSYIVGKCDVRVQYR